MRVRRWGTALTLLLSATALPATGAGTATAVAARAPHRPLPLARLFDNRAVSDNSRPGAADFDGAGHSLSAQDLAAAGWSPGTLLTLEGTRLGLPRTAPGTPDNVVADGQPVAVRGRGEALTFLVAGTGGAASGTGNGALPRRLAQHLRTHRARLAVGATEHQSRGAAPSQRSGRTVVRGGAAVRGDRDAASGAGSELGGAAQGVRGVRRAACVRGVRTRHRARQDRELGGEHCGLPGRRALDRPYAAAGRAQRRGRPPGTDPDRQHLRGHTGGGRGGQHRGARRGGGGGRRPGPADLRGGAHRDPYSGRGRGVQRSRRTSPSPPTPICW